VRSVRHLQGDLQGWCSKSRVEECIHLMPRLRIDSREVEVARDSSVLDAAKMLGIELPALCFLEGYEHFTSCMLCVVKEMKSDTVIPSCSAPALEGMIIETQSDEVRGARRDALELLLREHVGDCEAPCRMACPAGMNIPLMIRQIGEGDFRNAIATIKKDIPFPAVLGRICPAPCESACRRKQYDSPVAICALKRFAADADLASGNTYIPRLKKATGKRVAIIGAGPAGMTAAYFLVQEGHSCELFDDRELPGGMLRFAVSEERLDQSVLDREIDVLRNLGILFHMRTQVGKDVSIAELRQDFDAVVIAAGEMPEEEDGGFGADLSVHGIKIERGIKVDLQTLETNANAVFACGAAVRPARMAVSAVASGKKLACSVHQYLCGTEVTGPKARFNSRIGKLKNGEIEQFMQDADPAARVEPAGGAEAGFSAEEAIREAKRCMHCDCRKSESCMLRRYADEYGLRKMPNSSHMRKSFEGVVQHPSLIYEPGKCIKCGRCVRITEKEGERLGLAFLGRGYDVSIGVPFNQELSGGLEKSAEKCVWACPTGALAFRYEKNIENQSTRDES